MRVHWLIGLMLTAAVAVFFGAASIALAATSTSRLLFADEFATSALDSATWATVTPWYTSYTSGELEYYDPANVAVSGGQLHLASLESSANGSSYTSGIVTSLQRAQFSYGYFEIRAKLPRGQGVFPAFWLTNDNTLEIDAIELLGDRPARGYMTLHRDNEQVFQEAHDGVDLSAGYHTYGVDWQPTYVRWYVDGVRRATYAHAMPSDPMWICLDTAIGGPWPGSPNASTPFPQSFDIDYVRVWDKKPSNSGGTAAKKPVAAPSKADAAAAGTAAAGSAAATTAAGAPRPLAAAVP
jgi:beta-glucanase (GH16 family)